MHRTYAQVCGLLGRALAQVLKVGGSNHRWVKLKKEILAPIDHFTVIIAHVSHQMALRCYLLPDSSSATQRKLSTLDEIKRW